MLTATCDPGSSLTGVARGKNMGNQLSIRGVCVPGTVLMVTSL